MCTVSDNGDNEKEALAFTSVAVVLLCCVAVRGAGLWVVSFSLLAPSYFHVLFLLPGNGCA